MTSIGRATRHVAALFSALLLLQAGFAQPASVLAADPVGSPAPSAVPSQPPTDPGPTPFTDPSVAPNASPIADPGSTPPAQPSPLASPSDQPETGVELVDHRTAYSRTYAEQDGTWHVEEYADPIFYQAEGTTDWQPIDESFASPLTDGATTSVGRSPTQLSLFASDAATGFLSIAGGGHQINLGLPADVAADETAGTATVLDNGAYAEFANFLPGGIALRVFPHADGFKSFLVIPARPATNSFTFAINSGDLALVDNKDGSFAFHDSAGNLAGVIPHAFLVDSSDVEGRGGGLYSEAVTMKVTGDGHASTMTLDVDPAFLDSAVYPVYIDPTVTTFPTGATTANDTFASTKYPGSNFNTYQRPDSPFYHEMWHGNEPGTSYYNHVFIRFNDLEATLGATHIDSASLQLDPYWQYTHSTPKNSWVERVSADWDAGTLTWNNQPATDETIVTDTTVEGSFSDFDVSSAVQDVVNGVYANNGFMIHADSLGQTGWKRFVSRNDSSSLKPKLVVTVTPFGTPSVFYPNSATGETSTRTVNWTLPAGAVQGAYDIQIDTVSTFASPDWDSGTVTSAVTSGMIANSFAMTDGQLYYWRVKVKYGNNTTFSSWPAASGQFVYHQGATLGLPGFDSFESFDLGASDSASVNATTGNLVISHPIVTLPIQGSSLALGLTYNSESTVNAGTGSGWRLNAMRRLSELVNGNVVLTSSDGSVHTFTKISTVGTVTTYTRPSTIYATLRKDTSQTLEWTLTYRDQSVDSFDVSGTEGLLAKQADRFGNAVSFSYTSGTNRLYQATDPNGRVIDFGWNTSVSPAQLTSITDWAYVSSGVVQSGATGSRRQYRLFYDASGNLIGWSNPINTSGSCPTQGSNLTCLTYASNGLVGTIAKTQTYTTLSGGSLGTSSRTVTTTITYRGGEVSQIQDPEQTNASAPGATFTRIATDTTQVVRQGSPASTTKYKFVATTDSLARVASRFRTLSGTDIEQRTVWDTTYPIERASVTDNYGALLSTPARTVSYTYVASSMGLVSVMTELLTGTANRTTTHTYNANNDTTQVVVASGGSSTTTRYCYTTSGCSTSGTELTLNSKMENYVDGTQGGSTGNSEDVSTAYTYDGHGQKTLETRYNYDSSGNLLDSTATGDTYDANGNMTSSIANYADGTVSGTGDDVTPNFTTGARTDLTTVYSYDTAGNQISSADPRRAIALAQSISLNADDYVTRTEFDALNRATKNTAPRDPADASSPKYSTSAFDELGVLRQSIDFGGVVTASELDRAGRATRTFQDTDGGGAAAAQVTGQSTFDAGGRAVSNFDRNQAADTSLGSTVTAYDELGRTTQFTDASGSSPDASSTTHFDYDALGRETSSTNGFGDPSAQTTATAYDLGGRATSVDDEFTCTTTTYDYRDLALTETDGLDTGCASGADQRTVTNTYDGLGRMTRTEVTSGTGTGDRTFDVTLDSAGRQLTSAVKTGGVSSTTTYALDPVDEVLTEARPDGSTAKTNYDAAGNETDHCYWKPSVTVGSCYEVGHSGWTNPPTQVTTATYDARNNRIAFSDSATGTTSTYDPFNNYQISAFYLPTGTGKEHQTLYTYDARHRMATITEQLCVISAGHSCSSTTATGSDSYSYDDNDNRTTVNESNGATSSDQRYCYDALNRLQYRNTAAVCSSTAKNETYVYDSSGNRTQTVISGTTTNYAYNSSGELCKVGATTCGTPNVTYDSSGRTASYNGWVYVYDAEGRMTSACKSTSCTGSIDRVEFTYDGDGHRTEIKEYTAGTLTTTRDFRYQGDAIVQESTNGTVSREYIDDDQGSIIKFCDPNCTSPTTTYLVTWNGHGDALGAWKIDPSTGALTLVNSYTYTSWGAPTTTVASGFSDLGLRFLYVGKQDVQWDNFSGLALYYMHARHYASALGRFLQPDPCGCEVNAYSYAVGNPQTFGDASGGFHDDGGGGGSSTPVHRVRISGLPHHIRGEVTTFRQRLLANSAAAVLPNGRNRERVYADMCPGGMLAGAVGIAGMGIIDGALGAITIFGLLAPPDEIFIVPLDVTAFGGTIWFLYLTGQAFNSPCDQLKFFPW